METGITTDGVNLRADASTAAGVKIIRLLTKGTQITILDHNKAPWLHVQTSDSTVGYVLGDYVTIQSAASSGASTSSTVSAAPPQAAASSSPTISAPPPQAGKPAGAAGPIPDQTALYSYIASIPDNYPIPQGYHDFQAMRDTLGLPAPFDVPPTQLPDPSKLPLNGFGPNTFALNNWSNWYTRVCGMHNGLDHNIPTGTPLLALSDAIVVGDRNAWPFMASRYERTLVIWCLLPDDGSGTRKLSNVLIAYGHMSNNSVVKKGDMVKAGQVIGNSGYPHNEDENGKLVEQPGNAHLHMEVHMITGDNNLPFSRNRNPGLLRGYKGSQPFDNNTPFNPLLFFSERMVKYQMHQSVVVGRTYPDSTALSKASPAIQNWPSLDFFTVAYFQYPGQRFANIIWKAKNPPPWPTGVYGLSDALERMKTFTPFEPYPIPQSM
jgi:murein DD-endopeptidase MepM/ murein hydrolase activator NlpD